MKKAVEKNISADLGKEGQMSLNLQSKGVSDQNSKTYDQTDSRYQEQQFLQLHPIMFQLVTLICPEFFCHSRGTFQSINPHMPDKLIQLISENNGVQFNQTTSIKMLAHICDYRLERLMQTITRQVKKDCKGRDARILSKTQVIRGIKLQQQYTLHKGNIYPLYSCQEQLIQQKKCKLVRKSITESQP